MVSGETNSSVRCRHLSQRSRRHGSLRSGRAHRSLKRSKRSVFLDSPDLKKHMRSKHGELQAIISAGPSYILHTGTPGDIAGRYMICCGYLTQEHRCEMYNSYMPPWFGVFPVRRGRARPAMSNPLRYVTSARPSLTRPPTPRMRADGIQDESRERQRTRKFKAEPDGTLRKGSAATLDNTLAIMANEVSMMWEHLFDVEGSRVCIRRVNA